MKKNRCVLVLAIIAASLVSVVGVTTVSAGPLEEAKDEWPVTLGGTFFSRYEWRENYTSPASALGGSDAVRYRARIDLALTPLALVGDLTLRAIFTPQAGGFWHIGGDGLDDPGLGLHQGAVTLDHPYFSAQVGRFEMNYGDQLVIGSVGWHHIGRAFDGVRLRYKLSEEEGAEQAGIDAFFTVLSEGLFGSPAQGDDYGQGDVYFTGLYAELGPLISPKFALDVYALSRIWVASDTAGDPDATPAIAPVRQETAGEFTIGAMVKGGAGVVDYRFEAGAQLGARRAGAAADSAGVFGYQADAEVGVKVKSVGLRVGLEGFIASGDDPATTDRDEGYQQLFPTAHKWLGLMDVVGGRSDITGGVVHLFGDWSPVKVALDTHVFSRVESSGVPDENYLGVEADLNLIVPIGDLVKVRALYGLFVPNEAILGDDLLHFVELELFAHF